MSSTSAPTTIATVGIDLGKKDAEIPPEVRVYAFGGTQHGPAGRPPRRGSTDNLPNPVMDDENSYVPRNMPAIGDLMEMFRFSESN